MIRLFAGYDHREAAGFHAFCASVLMRAVYPVAITPLGGGQADGSNRFTYARYLVPQVCDYQGWAIFADGSDMVCLEDIGELWEMRDDKYAVMVVKHDYKTRHPIKYIGTDMQCPNRDYPRKNWSSLMLINCAAPEWNPGGEGDFYSGMEAHQFAFIPDERIGELPKRWNVLVDEGQDAEDAAILHWTAGIPAFKHYNSAPLAKEWLKAWKLVQNLG